MHRVKRISIGQDPGRETVQWRYRFLKFDLWPKSSFFTHKLFVGISCGKGVFPSYTFVPFLCYRVQGVNEIFDNPPSVLAKHAG